MVMVQQRPTKCRTRPSCCAVVDAARSTKAHKPTLIVCPNIMVGNGRMQHLTAWIVIVKSSGTSKLTQR